MDCRSSLGEAWPYTMSDPAARLLGAQLNQLTAGSGSTIICTSPRTPELFAGKVTAQLVQPAEIAAWQKGAENPYPALLEAADRFVVTGDSASMLAEACARQKPVYIFDLPKRSISSLINASGQALAQIGVLHPPRDMSKIHQSLVGGSHATRLGDCHDHEYGHVPLGNSLQAAADRIRAFLR